MTLKQKTDRQNRAQALVDLISKVEGGYRVASSQDPSVAYFVSRPDGRIVCTCSDFEGHFVEDPRWECKHILAIREAHRLGKLNGDSRDLAAGQAGRAPEATTTEDSSVVGFSEEEITPLESCGRCGRTFTADELFPTNGPDGSSLLCWECLYAVPDCERPRSGRPAQAGRETSATTTEEPPLTHPCICCGTDGLAYRKVVPHAMNLDGDEGTICLSCLADIREGRILERMGKDGVYVYIHPDGTKRRACAAPGDGADADLSACNAQAGTIPAQSPCGRCGRFLPLAQLEGEVCLECLSQEQAREGSEFKVHGSEVKTLNREPLNREPYSLQPSSPTLAEKVAMANEILASWGAVAIDTDQKGYTGYGFQYVIDAVNSALDPDGWRYELLTHQVEKSGEKLHKAFVLLQLHLRLANGSWFTKGPQFGGSQNVDPTDALKSALSDGLKKAFSHWGVGNIAYRGELRPSK